MPLRKIIEHGPKGLAKVTVTEDKIKVRFEGEQTDYAILPEDAPEGIASGKYLVELSPDENKIRNIKPPKGSYWAKFERFTKKKDAPLPIYKEVPAGLGKRKDGTQFPIPAHLEFTAVFVIEDSKDYNGMELTYTMSYLFKKDEMTGDCGYGGYGVKKLEKFLDAVGVDSMQDTIPYSDNVLPWLENFIKEKKATVMLTINEWGWVTELILAPSK